MASVRGGRGERHAGGRAGEAQRGERLNEVVQDRGGGGEAPQDLVLARARDIRVVDVDRRGERHAEERVGEAQRDERLDEVVRDHAGGEDLVGLQFGGGGATGVGGEDGCGERHVVERTGVERRGERGVGALVEKLRAWKIRLRVR